MLSEKAVEDKLVAFICGNFMVEPGEFKADESLVDQGVIDSIGLVEISGFMDREFGVAVAEKEMNRENFGSLNKMVAFLIRRISQ